MPGPVRTLLQTGYMPWVIAPLPTVEGLWADANYYSHSNTIIALPIYLNEIKNPWKY